MNQPLAYVHPDAKIAQNVTIEPFSTIYENVEIGEGTWIAPHVTIMAGARIGKNCRIFPGAVVSAVPQDLKFAGEDTLVVIGNNTTIRECVTINRGTSASLQTSIGNNCLVMAYVHIAHDCHIGNNCILVNSVQLAGHVEIDDFVLVGGTSAVHQFVRIGKHAMIPGGSLVRKDVPPYTKPTREPLRYTGVNAIGLRRRGFSGEQIDTIKDIYRTLYLKGMNVSQAVEAIKQEITPSPERDEILNFIAKAERGIIGSARNKKDKDSE